MAGLTNTGLTIKRLPEVIEDLNANAEAIFADLIPTGDTLDTTGESTIGRMIGLIAPAEADIWEAIQLVNDSFNPNAATGFALDNIVALSGISRLPAKSTEAQVLLTGNRNVIVGLSGKMSSSSTQRKFTIVNPVSLTPSACSGIGISVAVVQNSAAYRVSYSIDGVNFIDGIITSDASATAQEITDAIKAYVDANWAGFYTSYQDGFLFIRRTDPFQTVTFTTSANLAINKVVKPGLVRGDEIGPFPQAAFTIDTITVPIIGWDSVINPIAGVEGRYQETDEELRERFRNSKFFQASNILEALIDALLNVDGVTDVKVYENDTDLTDSNGTPPHSFQPIVLGGLPTAIGNAIWENKPTGILSYGTTSVFITDSQGVVHDIKYKIPTEVPIYIAMSITDNGAMPGDVVAQIQQAVVDYSKEVYAIGDDVIYSRFYTPINQIPGFQVNSLYIGTAPSPTGTANISIAFDAVAKVTAANISVTIV